MTNVADRPLALPAPAQEIARMSETDENVIAPQKGASILKLLMQHQAGSTVQELDGTLTDMIEHLENLHINEGVRKAKGTLTLKIVLDRDDGVYKITVEPSTKLPKAALPPAIFWATPGNGLSLENPRQSKLPFQDVPRRRVIIDA